MGKISHVHGFKLILLKSSYYSKPSIDLMHPLSRGPTAFLPEIGKIMLKFVWNPKNFKEPKQSLRKNKAGGITLSDLKLDYKALVINMVLA